MKKVLIVLTSVVMIAVGCKNGGGEIKTKKMVNDARPSDKEILQKEFKMLDKYRAFVSRKCTSEIVFYGKSECTSEFDVKEYIIRENDTEYKKFASWLKTNGSNICFDKTDPYIECIHHITDPSAIQTLELEQKIDTISFKRIQKAIKDFGVIDYKTDFYQHYVKIYIDEEGHAQAEIKDKYNPYEGGYYSLPFLRILVEQYGSKLVMQIKEAVLYGPDKKKFIGILDTSNEMQYYDFSQIPTVSPLPVTHYLFSPL